LDVTILQFLVGVLAGTASGLVLVLTRRSKSQPTQITRSLRRPSPQAARSRLSVTPPRTGTTRSRHPARPRAKTLAIPTVIVADARVSRLSSGLSISACPACGLEAPEALMSEHFLGSPLHRHGTRQPMSVWVTDEVAEESASRVEVNEDSESSMRNLLQMLVPPRAFGHRQQQKTVNPISRLVQTLESSQSALVQPLNGSSEMATSRELLSA
jgi:hypothetical protein